MGLWCLSPIYIAVSDGFLNFYGFSNSSVGHLHQRDRFGHSLNMVLTKWAEHEPWKCEKRDGKRWNVREDRRGDGSTVPCTPNDEWRLIHNPRESECHISSGCATHVTIAWNSFEKPFKRVSWPGFDKLRLDEFIRRRWWYRSDSSKKKDEYQLKIFKCDWQCSERIENFIRILPPFLWPACVSSNVP